MQVILVSCLIITVSFGLGFLASFLAKKLDKQKEKAQRAQVKKNLREAVSNFWTLYYKVDATQDYFWDKPSEEAIRIGQEILWEEAYQMSLYLAEALAEKDSEASERLLEGAYVCAVRIAKCVQLMHTVEVAGPLRHRGDLEEISQIKLQLSK